MNTRMALTMGFAAVAGSLFASTTSWHLAGDYNGWDPNGQVMTETGAGTGIFEATLSGLGVGARQEFKVTNGSWAVNWPDSNSWYLVGGSGSVRIQFDTNVYADGWSNSTKRLSVSDDVTTWTAVGGWQGWNNANGATAMTHVGGGVFKYSVIGVGAGTYEYKARNRTDTPCGTGF